LKPVTKPKAPRIGPLRTVTDCCRETAKNYRKLCAGEITREESHERTYTIDRLARMIRDHDFETRLSALERKQ